MRNGPEDLLDCGHPAAASVDRPGWGWCSVCAQQADAALPAAQPSRAVPSWATVAPLLARWQMALFPHGTDSWHVVTFWLCRPESLQHTARRVRFADLPQAIADLAQRCAADAKGEGEG